MPFDLGFLGGRGGVGAVPEYKAQDNGGLQLLAQVGQQKRANEISKGYLANAQQQTQHSMQKDYVAALEQEKNKRQAAIDAWLGAVRSGNRSDIWVLGKRLKGMGVNVQMPDAFSATGVPGEAESNAATAAEQAQSERHFDIDTGESRGLEEPSAEKQKQLSELDAMGKKVVGQLGGKADDGGYARAMAEAGKMTSPTSWAEQVSPGKWEARGGNEMGEPVGAGFGAPPTMSPFGPGGPTALKPPTSTWRISDPLTGADIEISPEQILADQSQEIDQSFAGLIKMPGLDPVAQRAYTIGYEFAKGQLGFMTPKEAVAAGMEAADRYMLHMYRQGMVSAQQLRAAKKAGGGGAGGAAPGFGGTELSKGEVGVTDKISDNVRATVTAVQSQENYKAYEGGLTKAEHAAGVLDQGTSLGERTAFRQLMTAVEQGRLSDKDAEWYQASGGILSRMESIWKYWAGGGKLAEPQIREIKSLIGEARAAMSKRLNRIKQQGAAAADAEIDVWQVKDPEQRKRLRGIARSRLGLSPEKGGGGRGAAPAGGGEGSSATQKWRRRSE